MNNDVNCPACKERKKTESYKDQSEKGTTLAKEKGLSKFYLVEYRNFWRYALTLPDREYVTVFI